MRLRPADLRWKYPIRAAMALRRIALLDKLHPL
jgi:hypothetical protein